MNEFNNHIIGYLLGTLLFIIVILFMIFIIYLQRALGVVFRKINIILKKMNSISDSSKNDKK